MTWKVKDGNALTMLRRMPAQSVDCVVTSPPYWSLREYSVPNSLWDGDPDCAHRWRKHTRNGVKWLGHPGRGGDRSVLSLNSNFCSRCGAWRGQLGLEPTPRLYVQHLVQIFSEIWRVLKPGATVWLNLGDTWYSRARSGTRMGGTTHISHYYKLLEVKGRYPTLPPNRMPIDGLKPKDLVGVPWMVAFALRSSGWWLRQEIIWHKTNGLAKVAKDRPAGVHETIFLLANARHYFYDNQANLEPASPSERQRREREQRRGLSGAYKLKRDNLPGQNPPGATSCQRSVDKRIELAISGVRRRRSVWTIPVTPYYGNHCSTFPLKIGEICISCGCPPGGTVLDPFCGSGTVGIMALRMGRNFIGIEADRRTAEEARERITKDAPLFNSCARATHLTPDPHES